MDNRVDNRNENKKRLSFGYEDTDKSIEIELYGLVFKINNLNNIKELESLDRNNESVIEAQLEKILGNGAIDKINNKRRKDGYDDLDLNVELNILGCIFETYAKGMYGDVINRVKSTVDDLKNDVNEFTNREQRRNYNRNQYRGNRRNYRRY
ncbi:MAG: hypothetical protein IKG42_04945 [Clostridia bacterium]|nr:hypothetical protein [Clostridia bacterium]